MEIVIKKSHNPKKKYDAIIDGAKTISFGAAGYSDYTLNKDDKRRDLYLQRHSKEDWTRQNIASAAWLVDGFSGKRKHYKKQSGMQIRCTGMFILEWDNYYIF